MKPAEYYKFAEKRIGEYDTHSFQCKKWLVVILGALITAGISYYRGKAGFPWPLFWAGILATVFVFLIDMCFRHVLSMLMDYAHYLEEKMAGASLNWDETRDGIGHWLRDQTRSRNNLKGLVCFIFGPGVKRPRHMLFYLLAIPTIGIALLIPARLSAAQQEPVKYPAPTTQAWHGQGWIHPEHRTCLEDQTYRPYPCSAFHKPYRCLAPPWWVVVLHAPVSLLFVAGLIVGCICWTVYKVEKLPVRAKKDEEATSSANKNAEPKT